MRGMRERANCLFLSPGYNVPMRSMPRKGENPEKKKRGDDQTKTLKTVAGLSVLIIAAAAFFLFGQKSEGASLTMEMPDSIRAGEPFDIAVLFENGTEEEITSATVSLSLPAGVSFTDGKEDARRSFEIKSMPGKGMRREVFSAVLTDLSDSKIFRTEAEYLLPSLGKSLSVTKESEAKVEKWLSIDIEAPDKIVAGEEFEWIFSYKNNSDRDWKINLELDIPKELDTDFPKSEISVKAGGEGKDVLTGSILMEEGKIFSIKAVAIGKIEDKEYVFDEAYAESLMAPSPLSLKINVAEGNNEPVSAGQEISYSISFRNNSDVPLENLTLSAILSGDMFKINSVSSRGNVNIPSRTVSWDATNAPELQEISPGESKSLELAVKIKDDYPITRLSDKNFALTLDARIESPTVPYSSKTMKTVNIASVTTKVSGKIEVSTKALYRDASSGMLNQGDLPLTVGLPTEFTIHWGVKSYSTDMSDVEVSAELPPGVELSDKKKVDAGEFESAEEGGKIVWKIPKVLATTGILSDPIRAIFQIRAIPLQTHSGGYMPILGPTNISAKDDFTGKEVSSFREFITTELKDDPTVKPNEGLVR